MGKAAICAGLRMVNVLETLRKRRRRAQEPVHKSGTSAPFPLHLSGGGAIKSHWSVYCDRPRKELQETRALRSFNVTHSKRQVLLPIDIREIKTVLLYAAIRAALDEVMEEQRQLEPQLLRNDEGVSPEKPANDH
ncbi:hypothetical protein QR680_011422 [Steinernema hermaphroditum]|uniref:Uncharacterized protein n=1 Tax=Steinernema hermaphroditum TaxID=289476 RepID=A0AA39HYJ2_9BILA|nr:hypothetical protein QR680_011422 [Steinernema hermaphroditum]